jgi:phosphocarrier protein HPr
LCHLLSGGGQWIGTAPRQEFLAKFFITRIPTTCRRLEVPDVQDALDQETLQYPDSRQPQLVQTVWVNTPEGLHLRKCAAIAELVLKYQARVTLQKGDHSEDAASVLGLMLLAAAHGTPLTVSATGPEADDAVRAVVALFDEVGEVPQTMRRS